MATTQNTFTGDGSNLGPFSFTFKWLEPTDIKVTVAGVLKTVGTHYNLQSLNYSTKTGGQVLFTAGNAPANGAAIVVYRQTDDSDLAATFYSGSAIRAQDLNNNFVQGLYVTQESSNNATTAIGTANTALTNSNTAISTANGAVSTANTASSNASAAVATANTANTNASAAVSTANTASSNASAAVSTANTASSNASTALSTANTALSTANTANTNASTAISTANTASANASAAVSTANTASSNASAAVSTANTASSNASTALSTANTAISTANAAASAVANAILYDIVANVAAIPASPANNDAVEVTDSTGIQSFTPLTGVPAGFVGSSGLSVRLVYTTTGSTWNWIQYFPNDPETRYLKLAGGTLTGDLTVANQGDIRLGEATANGSNYVAIQAPSSLAANVTYTLPSADGTSGQLLSTNGSGALSWATTSNDIIQEGNSSAEVIDTGSDGRFVVTTEGSERARVDSSGRLLVGTSSARANFYNAGVSSQNQIEGTTDQTSSVAIIQNYNAATYGAQLILAKSNALSIGSNTLVASGYACGRVTFQGNDGADFVEAARIEGVIDGTPGANDMPGRIVLSTTAAGASSPIAAVTIDSSQRVGIGTTSPSTLLHLASSSVDPTISLSRDPGTGNVNLIKSDFNDLTFTSYRHLLFTSGGTTERARIDSSGRLLVGTSSARDLGQAGVHQFQVEGLNENTSSAAFIANVNSTAGPYLTLAKSRGTSNGSNTVVSSGDELGSIQFNGADGTDIQTTGARISAVVDGTPGGNDLPTRLVFSTTADGASSPTERMRINNSGRVSMLTANFAGTTIASTLAASLDNYLIIGESTRSSISANDGTTRFIVYTNGNVQNSNNSYGAISDAKLKENIVDASSQWGDIKSLQVRKYNFKEETGQQTHTQIGLVAQEAELVSPGLVTESPDRDAEGNDLGTVTKSVNYSVLYMKAVKALQEAMERIEVLEQRLNDAGIN